MMMVVNEFPPILGVVRKLWLAVDGTDVLLSCVGSDFGVTVLRMFELVSVGYPKNALCKQLIFKAPLFSTFHFSQG
jgi:hypothetical protein